MNNFRAQQTMIELGNFTAEEIVSLTGADLTIVEGILKKLGPKNIVERGTGVRRRFALTRQGLNLLTRRQPKELEKMKQDERKEFCSEVSMLKFKAGALGLLYTMQKLDDAMVMVGYEVAGTPGEYAKAKEANLKAEAQYRRS
jgi:hypothetical protein